MKIMKARLLVVDDDQSVLTSLKKLLEAEQYAVYPARDATEALTQFKDARPDLVVLDINLGAENGWEVFQEMAVTNPFVPTIIITAEWGQQERAAALGVEGLIEKPIDVPVFLKMIRDLLAESSEEKQERICGRTEYGRFVGRHYEPYLRRLQERHAAPFRSVLDQIVPLRKQPTAADACEVENGTLAGSAQRGEVGRSERGR